MLAPTIIYLCSDETITSGTGKPVPYKVRRKFCTNIAQCHGLRSSHGLFQCSEPGNRNMRISANSMRL